MKQLLEDGAVGQIVNIQHLEPVAYWHQAHSFVRGNWRREDESSSMLLSKSCHDLDWIRYIMDKPCTKISSFGSLFHFRSEQRPQSAGDNCLSCDIEQLCPYSAKKIYIDQFDAGHRDWPLNVLSPDMDRDKLVEAVAAGPYGRCVYSCDNDVVDNQVVNLQFDDGTTASFTMTAFTDHSHRKTRVFGTHGMLEGDGETIRVNNFLTDITTSYEVGTSDASIVGEHGGGDYHLIEAFINALIQQDPTQILSGPKETLESHLMVFAAEEARKLEKVICMDEFDRRFRTISAPAVVS
jgi:predicted dehydrogenase